MRFAQQNFGPAALGSAIRRSGPHRRREAIAALTSGEWDPFEGAEIPR